MTATSKQADTFSDVITSSSGPAAMSDPARTRPPWVNPGGISSQWCVTRTTGGLASSAASEREPHEQALAGAQVEAGEGLVEQEELGIAHQRPGQQDLLALALRDHPEGPIRRSLRRRRPSGRAADPAFVPVQRAV